MQYIVVFIIIVLIVLIIALTVLSFYMYRTAQLERIVYQDLYFSNLPKHFGDVRVFFISDVHKRIISDQIIAKVQQQVDLVIIGGDLTERTVPFAHVEQNLAKLKSIGAPLYFVWGNNDYEVDVHELDARLLQYGVTILANTAVHLEAKQGEKMTLLGIEDITVERDRLDMALADARNVKDAFRILVSHNPKVKVQVQEEYRISLVLSGHTHGGQVRFFGYGPYKLGDTEMFNNCVYVTSNGYGTSTIPMRLTAKPETHLFTLKRGDHTSIGEKKEVQF